MIVGMCGYAGVGKDTAADALVRLGFFKLAFADMVRGLAMPIAHYFGLDLNNRKDKEILRPILVDIGRIGRQIKHDMWIKPVMTYIDEHPGLDFVIPDIRYHNEADEILKRDGLIFYIERPNYGPANDEEYHSIEIIKQLLKDDLIYIYNNRDVKTLQERIKEIVENEKIKL